MPASKDIRVPVSPEELSALKKRAGKEGLAGMIRRMLGLAPRKAGRPPKGDK